MNQAQHEADAAVQAAVELDGMVDAAEQAAVVLDSKEVVRRREERVKSLYRRDQERGRYPRYLYYCEAPFCCKQMVCYEESDSTLIENHIKAEHRDKLDEVEAEMRRAKGGDDQPGQLRGGGSKTVGGVLQIQLQTEKRAALAGGGGVF